MLDRTATRIFTVLAIAGLVVASFIFGFGVGRSSHPKVAPGFEVLQEVQRQIASSAIKKPDDAVLAKGAVKGMVQSLEDPYAAYLDPETYASFRQDVENGQYSGVGLWLKQDGRKVKIVSVLDGTPASKAGIQDGEEITAVEDRKVEDQTLDEVVQKIQGRLGTSVRITVSSQTAGIRDVTLVREQIEVPAVRSRLLKDRVGLVELISFTGGSGQKVKEAVESLQSKGARALILDMRGNPGGLVREAVDVASVFLPEGKVVSYKQRGRREVSYTTTGHPVSSLPLVLLVDEGSASASEIVAGAIQDRGRGIIIGTKTYGKGSIQDVFPLGDGSAIKLTIASYFTPSGRSIGGRGIEPDIAVGDKPGQLLKAQQVLASMLADAPTKRTG